MLAQVHPTDFVVPQIDHFQLVEWIVEVESALCVLLIFDQRQCRHALGWKVAVRQAQVF